MVHHKSMENSQQDIKSFWNKNPVGTNFIDGELSKDFFHKYDTFRYQTESHILKELDALDLKEKKVLEIGLGQGADSMQLIKRGAQFYGIDLTEESVHRIKKRFELFEIPYREVSVANAREIPYEDDFFDVVYSHGVIHHSPQIDEITAEIHRVLRPGGQAVIMLYHKSSFNYHVSIKLLRRMGLFLIFLFPFLVKIVSKLTGEGVARIEKHIVNFKKSGLGYLKMKNFIHKSTDGPDNVYSSVWTKKTSRKLLKDFEVEDFRVHFLNERHLMGLQKLLSAKRKRKIESRYGWHLWVFARKH